MPLYYSLQVHLGCLAAHARSHRLRLFSLRDANPAGRIYSAFQAVIWQLLKFRNPSSETIPPIQFRSEAMPANSEVATVGVQCGVNVVARPHERVAVIENGHFFRGRVVRNVLRVTITIHSE
jgi:hypothetical protein